MKYLCGLVIVPIFSLFNFADIPAQSPKKPQVGANIRTLLLPFSTHLHQYLFFLKQRRLDLGILHIEI